VYDRGLIKDTIKLEVPNEAGESTTVILRRGTEELREESKAWADYSADQGKGEAVAPLMVQQVPKIPFAMKLMAGLIGSSRLGRDCPPIASQKCWGGRDSPIMSRNTVLNLAESKLWLKCADRVGCST
jgi:hypothetical protein